MKIVADLFGVLDAKGPVASFDDAALAIKRRLIFVGDVFYANLNEHNQGLLRS